MGLMSIRGVATVTLFLRRNTKTNRLHLKQVLVGLFFRGQGKI